MKKIVSILSLTVILFYYSNFASALNSVVVSAVVGNLNHSPVIIKILPSYNNSHAIAAGTPQNFALYFRDDEKDTIYYTITTNDGFTNPINGKVNPSDYDSTGSGATINFTYMAGSLPVGNSNINIILNDGPNIVSKDIKLYIY